VATVPTKTEEPEVTADGVEVPFVAVTAIVPFAGCSKVTALLVVTG